MQREGKTDFIFFFPFVSSRLTLSHNYEARRKQNLWGGQLIMKLPVDAFVPGGGGKPPVLSISDSRAENHSVSPFDFAAVRAGTAF